MMWLIDVHTYTLQEFLGSSSNFPNYAILSHTWEDEEVSFQDLRYSLPYAKQKKGFKKIKYCCEQAAQDGFTWAWVDTCCIDKTSSAELSEAINSMYNWYETAMVCYAYLSDVGTVLEFEFYWDKNARIWHRASLPRWFTRGWTLQELIAPLSVNFFTRDWLFIGTKRDNATRLSNVTGIDSKVLRHEKSPLQLPVAQRMYWASRRATTRAEDLSYCLMGLFDVNMPLLYGEGTKAFDRLQEQILRTTNDDTLFLWQMRSPDEDFLHFSGHSSSSRMLDSSPSDFDRRADHYSLLPEEFFCEPQLMPRQLGLRLTLPMRKMDLLDFHRLGLQPEFELVWRRIYIAALGCVTEDAEGNHVQVVILLEASKELDSPEKKVLRRVQHTFRSVPLQESRLWQKYTCFVAGDAPISYEKNNKVFVNRVDLGADTTFAVENVEVEELLSCRELINAAFIFHYRLTGRHYLLTYAMDAFTLVDTQPRAYVQFETLPAEYDTIEVKKRYSFYIPQLSDWNLYLRRGYGPVLEYEVSVEGAPVLLVVLKCEEDKVFNYDRYKLHVRCTRLVNTSL